MARKIKNLKIRNFLSIRLRSSVIFICHQFSVICLRNFHKFRLFLHRFLPVILRLYSVILHFYSVILSAAKNPIRQTRVILSASWRIFQDLLHKKFLFLNLIIKNSLKISFPQPIPITKLIPHYPQLKTYLPYLLLFLLFLTSALPHSGLNAAAWKLGQWPKNIRFHLELANASAQIHSFQLVQKEISLANSFNPYFVHQRSSTVDQILDEKITKNQIIQEISSWEEIIKTYPYYRDAYLKLSLLYWQINSQLKADTYLQKAFQLSPNYPLIAEIKQLFQK